MDSTYTFSYFQRENIELFLKGCEAYGLKPQDLFQVNDLYENKNLYMIVDNLFLLGGHVSSNYVSLNFEASIIHLPGRQYIFQRNSIYFLGTEKWIQWSNPWCKGRK